MDSKDRKILALLQADAMLTAAEVAERVGLTTTPCWRRIQKLEEQGYIKERVALLDRQKMNMGITVFVGVRTNRHSGDWLSRFTRTVQRTPEIVEAHRMSGDLDYLQTLQHLHQRTTALIDVLLRLHKAWTRYR